MVVTPPAAAAWLAEAMVSRCSRAGLADEGAHVDEAGRHHLAPAIDDLGALGHAGGADAALGLADHAVGEQEVARRCRDRATGSSDAPIGKQDRPALGDHHGDRLCAERASGIRQVRASASSTAMRTATPISTCSRISDWRAVGDGGVDLDAAVHRARMHDQRVRLGVGELLLVEPEDSGSTPASRARTSRSCARAAGAASSRCRRRAGPRACRVSTSTPNRSMPTGSSVEGATTRTRAPSALSRRMFERATRECRMSPQMATVRPLDAALVAADGERVEQRLGRMLVRAVAGIDHGAIDLARQQLDRARGVMADHDDVRAHGVEGDRGVDQRLALAAWRTSRPPCS